MKAAQIKPCDICNLSTIPIRMPLNPLRLISELILKKERNILEKSLAMLDISKCPIDPVNTHRLLPWYYKKNVNDVFLNIYLNKEYKIKQITKMQNLTTSIQTLGYKPKQFPTRQNGFITGYFLKHREEKRFYIMSGNHRAAILSALFPRKKIPIAFNKLEFLKAKEIKDSIFEENRSHPNVFDSKDVLKWPAVSSGYTTREKAIKIFETYFK
jgi:hypothetical protein